MRSDCTSLSSLFGFCFGLITVFSMVFAISFLRHREKFVVVVVEHRFGDVDLVTTVISTISICCSGCVSLESLLSLLVAWAAFSLLGEFSLGGVFVEFSILSMLLRYRPAISLPFKYETAGVDVFCDDRLLKLLTCNLFEVRG